MNGREEGLKEGLGKRIPKVAKKYLKDGTPISKIAELTGLSEDEIRSL